MKGTGLPRPLIRAHEVGSDLGTMNSPKAFRSLASVRGPSDLPLDGAGPHEPEAVHSGLHLSRRRVVKNTASQIASSGLSFASKALVAVVLARVLGPPGYGRFTLVWSVAGTVAVLALLGLDYRLIREMARRRTTAQLEESLPLACLLGLGAATLMVTVPFALGASGSTVEIFAAGAAYVLVFPPAAMFAAAFHAAERMELETSAALVESTVVLAAVATVWATGAGIAAGIAALGLGKAAALVFDVALYNKTWGRVRLHPPWRAGHLRRWPALLRESTPMALCYAFTALFMRVDIVMLSLFRPPRQVGLYGAAVAVVLVVPVVAVAFNGSIYPALSRARGPDDPEVRQVLRKASKLLVVLGIASAALLTVTAGPIVHILFGDRFAAAAPLLALVAWMLPLRFVNNLLGVALTATDRQGRRTAAMGIALAANVGSNLVLLPELGAWGAVISTLFTEVVLVVVLLSLSRTRGSAPSRQQTPETEARPGPGAKPDRYRLEELERAGAFVDGIRATRGKPLVRARLLVASFRQVFALVRILISIPRREVATTHAAAGEDLRAFLEQDLQRRPCRRMPLRHPGEYLRNQIARRLAIGVLDVPAQTDSSPRAATRQHRRGDGTSAEHLGLTYRQVAGVQEQLGVVAYVLARSRDRWIPGEAVAVAARIRDGRAQTFAVFDAEHRPVAVAVAVCDREWAYLRMTSALGGDGSAEARHLLQARLAQQLGRTGTRYLIASSMLDSSPQARATQHQLGFRACNLRLDARTDAAQTN